MGVVVLIALLAAEVVLQLAGKADLTISNMVSYAIPLIIGFLVGVPVNPGTTTSPKV